MIKDSPYIKENNGLIEINYGRRFPLRKSYGLIFLVFLPISIQVLINNYSIIFFLLIFFVIAVFTANNGVQIDLKEKVCNKYFSIFWTDYFFFKNSFELNCIVIKNKPQKDFGVYDNEFGEGPLVSEKFMYYDVLIMDDNHLEYIKCGNFNSLKDAKKFAQEVQKWTKLSIEKYSPRIKI